MTDYTAVTTDYNKAATDAAATDFTGTTIAFGGSAGANEFRWCTAGGGAGGTGSAAWPNIIKPGSNTFVAECWAFSADTTGIKCVGYPTAAPSTMWSRAFRFNFDALGSPASAMQFSAFQDAADTTPTPGTQTANAVTGSNIINGTVTDCGAGGGNPPSYFKINAYGCGFPSAGAQETPAAASLSTSFAITDGTAGAIVPGAAAWVPTHWQAAQGWTSYIQGTGLVKVTTAFFWYFNCAMFVGPTMQTGIMVFSPFVLQYTWT